MRPNANDQEWTAVEYSVNDGIAQIKLNRPQYRNAQNSEMTYQIERAMYLAAQDDDGPECVSRLTPREREVIVQIVGE